MYNVVPILISYIILIIAIYIFTLKGMKEKNIGINLLKILPISIIIDIPINYIFGVDKVAISLRLWNFVTLFIIIIFYKEVLPILKKGIKYFLFLYVFLIIHLILTGFSFVVVRAYIKFIFSYIPLMISVKIFIDKLSFDDQISILKLSAIITITISLFQIIMFRFLHINLFIIPLFQKISGTFSEPVWSGVYLGFIFIALSKSKTKVMRLLCIVFMVFSASEIAIIGLLATYILTSRKRYSKWIVMILSIALAIIFIDSNTIEISNLQESFYIHISNWILNLIAYSRGNLLQLVFGLGISNASSTALGLDIYLIAKSLGINSRFMGLTLNELGGDAANIIVEFITSFGIIGFVIFILVNIRYIRKLAYNKCNKLYLRIYIYCLIISLIHPLYYMGFGIFMIMYSLLNHEKENRNGEKNCLCTSYNVR